MQIRVGITTPARPEALWRELADIAGHAEWMLDAESIEFVGDQRTGVGTAFACRTKVGPLRTIDRMVVIEWTEGESVGVRHDGLVTGTGRFTIAPAGGGSAVTWIEELRFPRRRGGAVTTWLARPILRAIWRANLRRLAARAEGTYR